MNVQALKQNYEMHLENLYQFDFHRVCKAFIKKYQNENLNFTMTTIAHVSTID